MTTSRPDGPSRRVPRGGMRSRLGVRLLAAFLLVSIGSVVLLAAAALVGTDLGLSAASRQDRQATAQRAARAAGAAYAAAGGWAGADLVGAGAIAEAAGAQLVVRDTAGTMVWPGHARHGGGPDRNAGAGHSVVSAPVTAAGRGVGTVHLVFPDTSGARTVAWTWIIAAAAVALALAVATSLYVTRRLTAPLHRLAAAAGAVAAGDRSARTGGTGPGELGAVSRAFDTMADHLDRADRTRRQLTADVAHELRTPLAALQAGLEELRDGLQPAGPARLAALHDQALRLGRTVEDLSELAAAEAAALTLHPTRTDLTRLVGAAVDGQQPRLDAAGLTVHRQLTDPAFVEIDPDRIHQAVTNLLANTARYCRPGDQVTVRVAADGDGALIEVTDTGPGIPADELPHVFQRFWRGSSARDTTGSGIGLAVVREITAAHGGTVQARSSAHRDTTITLRLPGPAGTSTAVAAGRTRA